MNLPHCSGLAVDDGFAGNWVSVNTVPAAIDGRLVKLTVRHAPHRITWKRLTDPCFNCARPIAEHLDIPTNTPHTEVVSSETAYGRTVGYPFTLKVF